MKRLFILMMACFCIISAHAAYLRNIPMTVNQPDGTILQCFASGDEFFNYLHDSNGYTIIQHPQTGYYVYAEKRDGKLVATNYIAGVHDPASKGLKPYALISPEEWTARRLAWEVPEVHSQHRDYIPNHGTLNNISIFIRFSDDEELTNTFSSIDNMFNDVSENAISMRSYFRAASYGSIEIPTTFYPGHDGETIISYQDSYPRNYFQPYNASTNTNGYQDDDERTEREFSLLERAVNYINSNYPVPTSLNIDYDNDGMVDNVCFIVKGEVGAWSSLLWPHKWSLYDRTVLINGKRVWTFNFQLSDADYYFNASTMCHEMNHSLSAPDLYHYYNGTNISPVGSWDLMELNATPPQHCGAYMKMKYGHWIDEIPEITQAGTYTLNPISSSTPTNVAYKIASTNPDQYYVLEYRDKTSLFETALPGSGLLIYRINTSFNGNAGYDPDNGIYDEVYLFRPGGSVSENGNLNNAYFSSNVDRTEFSFSTSAYPFFTDGTIDYNFMIYNITSAGNTISFMYGTSSLCDPPTNLVASVEDNNVSLSWNAASNAQSYNIYRNGSLIGNTSGTTYLDSNLAYGIHNYFLKSIDANGLLSTSSETVTVNFLPEGFILIGDGSSATSDVLPSYSYYKYALTQQIYTSNELGEAGTITSIAFYNGGAEKTRTYDFYLKSTTKSAFSSTTDWETVTEADKVFSGSVVMVANDWTVITLDNPFFYDGTSNLVLVSDDNSGAWTGSPHMSCSVFNASSQAIRIYSDGDNYDPFNPTSYTGTLMAVKNQLLVAKEIPTIDPFIVTVSANPVEGGSVTMESRELAYDFEDGTAQGWTLLKGTNGNSPNNWMHVTDYTPRDYTSGNGHNSSDGFMLSESYISGVESNTGTAVTPDNYLVSPQVRLGGSISFWASNPNDSYGAEHFAVAVSTNGNTSVSDFTTVQEWTLLSKALRTGNTRNIFDGTWYEYTADLSEFSGLGYVAIHHFNCYDQWLLCIDDITIVEGTSGGNIISGIFNPGETCTVTATPNTGYHFAGWIEDGQVISTNSEYSFTVANDRNLVAEFGEGILIGDGSNATNVDLPSNSYYKFTLSQQIYTSEELGDEGLITSIAFYNGGTQKTRTYDFYMKATEKTSFADNTDWETVTSFDKVFSGSVVMVANDWTIITLNNPFFYDGTSNIVLVTDDNTGTYESGMKCTVYNAPGQAIYVRSDGTNYDPSNPSSYSGTVLSEKNQILITKEAPSTNTINITVSVNLAEAGSVSGGGVFDFGEICTLTATVNIGYYFIGWAEDGAVVTTDLEYSFMAVHDRDLVAMFGEGFLIGDGGTTTNNFLPSHSFYKYSLTQQIYTADEIGTAGTITSIAFYNGGGEKTRIYDMYLVNTDKIVFDSITDWIAVTETDRVFSDTVDMVAGEWTVFTLDTPFVYDGTSNLALIMDDNTGSYSSGMSCKVFNANGNQSIRIYSDGTNYDPTNPSVYNGTLMNVKNQIMLGIITSQTITKEINAYTEDGGYYLISVPIEEVNPAEVEHMLANEFDLYAYDQAEELEWRNYKSETFNLESGKGYLYANNEDVILSITSTSYSGNGEVTLNKTGDAETAGWNLVGNPFAQTAYINRDFYVMNADGNEIVAAERNNIEPMEGVFVIAEEDGETLTFNTEVPAKSAMLVLNLSQDHGVIDRAIVRFDQSRQLRKFQLWENSTKVYIPQEGIDYAVVSVGRDGVHTISTMDVNFKAEENGTYTLSFSSENVRFGYLHLIDQMTGNDVDLLANPSYSFEAKTIDKAERFKVEYAVECKE